MTSVDPATGVQQSDDLAIGRRNNALIFQLVYLGFIISGLIAILVIGGVIFLSVFGDTNTEGERIIPPVLENWGGVIVGFYFGTFVSLIKDYMKASS